jgi:hypothetical protein
MRRRSGVEGHGATPDLISTMQQDFSRETTGNRSGSAPAYSETAEYGVGYRPSMSRVRHEQTGTSRRSLQYTFSSLQFLSKRLQGLCASQAWYLGIRVQPHGRTDRIRMVS